MDTFDAHENLMDEDGRTQEGGDAGHASHHHHEGHRHAGHHHHHEEPMSQDEAVRSLLSLGQVALDAQDYESAVEAYASALKLEQDVTALYNLGSLYARGLGVRRSYVEAARLFHQAELLGNERAGKLCGKCMFDHVHVGFAVRTPADLFGAIAVFVSLVYPEATDAKAEVNRGLFAIAATHYNKGEYAEAAKVFRAAAEFGDDGFSQYYLGELYSVGAGVSQSDLAALYWFDCAVDNGAADVARERRDGIFEAYGQALSGDELQDMLATLAGWCEAGTADVPANPDKAARWREAIKTYGNSAAS